MDVIVSSCLVPGFRREFFKNGEVFGEEVIVIGKFCIDLEKEDFRWTDNVEEHVYRS